GEGVEERERHALRARAARLLDRGAHGRVLALRAVRARELVGGGGLRREVLISGERGGDAAVRALAVRAAHQFRRLLARDLLLVEARGDLCVAVGRGLD